jgi:hypothetical protein
LCGLVRAGIPGGFFGFQMRGSEATADFFEGIRSGQNSTDTIDTFGAYLLENGNIILR